MDSAAGRLRNYLTDHLEECTDADVEERVEYLAGLADHPDEDIELDVRVFSALANETRYEILRVLDRTDEELCVCEINAAIDASEATISQALSTLAEAGLATRRKDGRWRKYRATSRAVALITVLDGLKRPDA